jgi:hypothetical protein
MGTNVSSINDLEAAAAYTPKAKASNLGQKSPFGLKKGSPAASQNNR